MIVSRFVDAIGAAKIPVLDLAGNYEKIEQARPGADRAGAGEDGPGADAVLRREHLAAAGGRGGARQADADGRARRTWTSTRSSRRPRRSATRRRTRAASPGSGPGSGPGVAIGQQMAGAMAGAATARAGRRAPPPLPGGGRSSTSAINGQQAGPFDLPRLAAEGPRRGGHPRRRWSGSRGWPSWVAAETVPELQALFAEPAAAAAAVSTSVDREAQRTIVRWALHSSLPTPPMPDDPNDLPVAKPVEKDPTVTQGPAGGPEVPVPGSAAPGSTSTRGPRRSSARTAATRRRSTADADAEVVERDYLEYLDNREDGDGEPIAGRSTADALHRLRGGGAARRQGRHREVPVLQRRTWRTSRRPPHGDDPAGVAAAVRGRPARGPRGVHAVDRTACGSPRRELKKLANLGQLSGVYVPYWTYDAMTYTFYDGERGDNYTRRRRTPTATPTGRPSSEPQHGHPRSAGTSVSGEVQHFFDDVLVCGSKSLPQRPGRRPRAVGPGQAGAVPGRTT